MRGHSGLGIKPSIGIRSFSSGGFNAKTKRPIVMERSWINVSPVQPAYQTISSFLALLYHSITTFFP